MVTPDRSRPGHWTLLVRATAIWVLIIAAESVNGVLRTILVEPLTGDLAARQLGVAIGALIILAVALLTCRWLGARTAGAQLSVGFYWVALTVGFEVGLGRALGYSWDRIASDYDITEGGLLPLGFVMMALAPFVAARLRRVRFD